MQNEETIIDGSFKRSKHESISSTYTGNPSNNPTTNLLATANLSDPIILRTISSSSSLSKLANKSATTDIPTTNITSTDLLATDLATATNLSTTKSMSYFLID
jgi:hypothetical protein